MAAGELKAKQAGFLEYTVIAWAISVSYDQPKSLN